MRAFTVTSAIAIAAATCATACTFFSGVEGLELRPSKAADTTAGGSSGSSGADAGSDANDITSPFPTFGNSDAGGGGFQTTSSKPSTPGPALCGAVGTWTGCAAADDATVELATCADLCQSAGKSCVESCCANDAQGDYPAQVGLVYAAEQLTCDVSSIPSNSSAGLCTDPILPLDSTLLDVRCCCK